MTERIKAIISAAVVLAANIAALWGVSIDTETWVDGLCAVVMLASTLWAIWKNHNFTLAAAQGQMVTDKIKNETRALKLKEKTDA